MKEGDIINGRYELRQLIGLGSSGSVYSGRHVQLDRPVALKLLRPELTNDAEAVERFLREAKAAAGIGSEHIAAVTDVGQTDEGLPFLVMEYLEGQTLARAMREQRQFDTVRAARIGIQICRALTAAHDKGIVHRDMKPDNVFLVPREDGSEFVKILDFGIAKILSSTPQSAANLTASGTTLGTPYYMAPEQARAAKDLDGRTDIYATGVVLYEMLTGAVPFTGPNFSSIVIAATTSAPPPLRGHRSELPQELEQVVLKAIARDREHRYASARDLAVALEAFSDGFNAVSTSPSNRSSRSAAPAMGPPTAVLPASEAPSSGRRGLLPALLMMGLTLGVMVVVAIGAGGWYLYQRGVEEGAARGVEADDNGEEVTTPPPPTAATVADGAPKPPDPPSSAPTGADTLAAARLHLEAGRFDECLEALNGIAPSAEARELHIRCLFRANHQEQACALAQGCDDSNTHCQSFQRQYCSGER